MKFALFLLGSWTEQEASAQSRIFGEMVEQAEYAEELGFDSIWIAEHHSSRYGICPSLMPLLSHISARTKKIRIGAGVSVLPFHNPIFLAEESAMLDVLSNGRLDFGVGAVQRTTSTVTSISTLTPGTCGPRRPWTSSWGCGRKLISASRASSTR